MDHRFSLSLVTVGPVFVEREGYERVELDARPNMTEVPMQRVLRVPAGDSRQTWRPTT